MPQQTVPPAFVVDLAEFLTGSPDGEVDLDDIFAKPFSQVLKELQTHDPADLQPEPGAAPRPSRVAPGYVYQTVPAGVLLYSPDGQAVGGYLSCDLSLDEDHQGKGLGTELVIERCLRDGVNPTTYLDSAAYSEAGHAAHCAAWRTVREEPGRFSA